jgi:hypothetical protein
MCSRTSVAAEDDADARSLRRWAHSKPDSPAPTTPTRIIYELVPPPAARRAPAAHSTQRCNVAMLQCLFYIVSFAEADAPVNCKSLIYLLSFRRFTHQSNLN